MTWAAGPVVGASAGIAVLTSVLASYSWSRRREPGARALAIASVIATMWAVASLLEAHVTDPEARIWWYGVATSMLLPMVCAVTAFVLAYAGLDRHLTRRRMWWALVVPSVVDAVLVVTNPLHGWVWSEAVVDGAGAVRITVNGAGWAFLAYYAALGLLNLTVLAVLILRSPSRRRAAGLMFLAHVSSRYTFAHEIYGWDFPLPVTPGVLTVGVPFVTYAVALFGLRIFDPVATARRAALEQMADGVVVADADGTVIEANPAAVRMLGGERGELRGRPITELAPLPDSDPTRSDRYELELGPEGTRRHHVIDRSILTDETGRTLGQLYLVHDVTEQRGVQERLLEQQQALTRLTEREHLARDLHDGVGQVLGFVSMQAQAVRKRLADGEAERADAMLVRLAEVAQQAHGDVRELILSLKSGPPAGQWSLAANLAALLGDFQRRYGVRIDLGASEQHPDVLNPDAGVQVLRVVQEALSNARRHADVDRVRVRVEGAGDRVRITVEDDGVGFDAVRAEVDPERQFGLSIMRERMGEIGGTLEVDSSPGQGTRVTIEAPVLAAGADQEDDT